MKNHWPDFSFDLYRRACSELNYPEVPFARFIKSFIRSDDVVLDIGCGIGIPAMYIAKLCKKVVAIDSNKTALDYFNKEISRNSINNIETILGVWPETTIKNCDVAVIFYVGNIADNKDKLITLLKSVRRGGIIICNALQEESGLNKNIADRLGVKAKIHRCRNGCYVRGGLEMLGCKVKCELINHEFGQPVNDLAEAAKFVCWQLHLDESQLDLISNVVKDYIVYRNGQMYIPKTRSSCVITFTKCTLSPVGD